MKYHVNEDCIGCGLCCATCPEVFSMAEGGVATAGEGEVPQGAENDAAAAKAECPVGAIEQA